MPNRLARSVNASAGMPSARGGGNDRRSSWTMPSVIEYSEWAEEVHEARSAQHDGRFDRGQQDSWRGFTDAARPTAADTQGNSTVEPVVLRASRSRCAWARQLQRIALVDLGHPGRRAPPRTAAAALDELRTAGDDPGEAGTGDIDRSRLVQQGAIEGGDRTGALP